MKRTKKSDIAFYGRIYGRSGIVPESRLDRIAEKVGTSKKYVRKTLLEYGYRIVSRRKYCPACGELMEEVKKGGVCASCYERYKQESYKLRKPAAEKKNRLKYKPPEPELPEPFEPVPSVPTEDLLALREIKRNIMRETVMIRHTRKPRNWLRYSPMPEALHASELRDELRTIWKEIHATEGRVKGPNSKKQ